MRKSKSNLAAVSSGKHYIRESVYTVKFLIVAYSGVGQPFWYVRSLGAPMRSEDAAERSGKTLAQKYNIPFIPGIRHGQPLNELHRTHLKEFGHEVINKPKPRRSKKL